MRKHPTPPCEGVTPSRSRVAFRAVSSPCAAMRRWLACCTDAPFHIVKMRRRSLRSSFLWNYRKTPSFSLRAAGELFPHTPLRGCYTLALPYYLFVACTSTRVVKEQRRKISRAGILYPHTPLRGYYTLALPRRDPRVFVAVRRSSAGGSPVARSLLITS